MYVLFTFKYRRRLDMLLGLNVMILISSTYWIERCIFWDVPFGYGNDDQSYYAIATDYFSRNGTMGSSGDMSAFSILLLPISFILYVLNIDGIESYLSLNLAFFVLALDISVSFLRRDGIRDRSVTLFVLFFTTFQPVINGYIHFYREGILLLAISLLLAHKLSYLRVITSILLVGMIRGFSLVFIFFYRFFYFRTIFSAFLVLFLVFKLFNTNPAILLSDIGKKDRLERNVELVGVKELARLRMERRQELFKEKSILNVPILLPFEFALQGILNPITIVSRPQITIGPDQLRKKEGYGLHSFFIRNVLVVFKLFFYGYLLSLFKLEYLNWKYVSLFVLVVLVSGQVRHLLPFVLIYPFYIYEASHSHHSTA